jgi:choline kinase
MRAIILAAGESRRLGDLTRDIPKCCLEVGERSLLEHQVAALRAAGVVDVTVVSGHAEDVLRRVGGPDLDYLRNDVYRTTNSIYSLWLARDLAVGGFVLMNGDVLFDPRLLRRLLDDPREDVLTYDPTSVLEEEEMKIRLDGDRVAAMSKELSTAESHGENVGLLKFGKDGSAALFAELETIIGEGTVGTWAPFAFDRLSRTRPLYALPTDGLPWIEIDFPEDLDRARREIWPAIRDVE